MYCVNTMLSAMYVNTPEIRKINDQNVTIICCMVTIIFQICLGIRSPSQYLRVCLQVLKETSRLS